MGWAVTTVDPGNGVAVPLIAGSAARTSGVSDSSAEVAFLAAGVFFDGELFFFFAPFGVGDFFFDPALRLLFAFADGDALGVGVLRGVALGVGVAVDLGFLPDFPLVDLLFAAGDGVAVADSISRAFAGVSAPVCA